MRIVQILSPTLIAVLMFVACDKDNDYDNYSTQLIGTWIATEMEDGKMKTNEIFVRTYRADGTMTEAQLRWTGQESEWTEIEGTYTLNEDKLSECIATNSVRVEIEIEGDEMSYEILNGNKQSFEMKRISTDLHNQFVGIWTGYETSAGASIPAKHTYWQYFSDHSYKYYYHDGTAYVSKEDNDGKFFLYGNLLVSNYKNDLQTGGQGKTCECWIFEINNNPNSTTMNWSALREGSISKTFSLTKVDNLPSN